MSNFCRAKLFQSQYRVINVFDTIFVTHNLPFPWPFMDKNLTFNSGIARWKPCPSTYKILSIWKHPYFLGYASFEEFKITMTTVSATSVCILMMSFKSTTILPVQSATVWGDPCWGWFPNCLLSCQLPPSPSTAKKKKKRFKYNFYSVLMCKVYWLYKIFPEFQFEPTDGNWHLKRKIKSWKEQHKIMLYKLMYIYMPTFPKLNYKQTILHWNTKNL